MNTYILIPIDKLEDVLKGHQDALSVLTTGKQISLDEKDIVQKAGEHADTKWVKPEDLWYGVFNGYKQALKDLL